MAQWQGAGFAHGVMNSDNMSILGLTLDYGPFGFLDTYQAGYICNHSDHQGRYAFAEQPGVALFNLSCLAQALLPLFSDDKDQAVALARASLENYWSRYDSAYRAVTRAKLGLTAEQKGDQVLWQDLLAMMEGQVDYTRFFRDLCRFNVSADPVSGTDNNRLRDQFVDRAAFDAWVARYRSRLQQQAGDDRERCERMQQVNPKYILRNYLAEQAIRKAEDEGDNSEIERLLTVLRRPYAEQPEFEAYAAGSPDWAKSIAVSCSS